MIALATGTPPAFGWGCPAHKLTGRIAAARLNATAAAAVNELLDGDSLADVACWADEIRPFHPETKRWHYVDIPRRASSYVPSRDCALTEQGDCLLAALERATSTLRRPDAGRSERAEALRYLVHFAGDLHQPLHCADDDDHGGNGVAVVFNRTATNLHALWDTALLAQAAQLDDDFTNRVLADGESAPPAPTIDWLAWAIEGHAVAVASVYGDLPADRTLDAAYVTAHAAVLAQQLSRSGARLGDVLNLALSGTATVFAPATEPRAERRSRTPRRTRSTARRRASSDRRRPAAD